MTIVHTLIDAARRRLLGVSPQELRAAVEDVRSELRATRTELAGEIATLRRELDALPSRQDRAKGPEIPVAEA